MPYYMSKAKFIKSICPECEIPTIGAATTRCPECFRVYHQQCFSDFGCHVCKKAKEEEKKENRDKWARRIKIFVNESFFAQFLRYAMFWPLVCVVCAAWANDLLGYDNPITFKTGILYSTCILAVITSTKLNKLIRLLSEAKTTLKGTEHDNGDKNEQL